MIIAFSVNLSHEQTPLCEEIVAPSCKSLFTSKFSERIKRANSENANLLLVFATFCSMLNEPRRGVIVDICANPISFSFFLPVNLSL